MKNKKEKNKQNGKHPLFPPCLGGTAVVLNISHEFWPWGRFAESQTITLYGNKRLRIHDSGSDIYVAIWADISTPPTPSE